MPSKKVIRKNKFEGWLIKWLRRLKIVVGVVSFACFVIQAEDLTKQYLKYSTVVTTELASPKQIELPAVTVCKPVVFGYRQFCSGNESDGECVDRWVREAGLKIEPGDQLNADQQGLVLTDQEDKLLSSKPLLHLFGNMSLSKNFHGTQCWFGRPIKKGKYIEMEKFNRTEQIIWSIINNFDFGSELCFTVFSQLAVDYEKIIVSEILFVAYFTLAFNNSEWYPPNFNSFGYHIAVHPANLIPHQSFWQFHRIHPNKYYAIEYGMTRMSLLPSPYQTNCRDYQPPGPLSHRDCFVRCMFNSSWDLKRQCYGNWMVIILNHLQPTDRTCAYDFEHASQYLSVKNKCEESCPRGCYEEHFSSVRELLDDDNQVVVRNDSNRAEFRIQYSTKSDLIIRHHPEIMFGNFVASIGGLAGVYLGISILSMYEYFCSLLEKVCQVRGKVKVFSRQ